jgi:hypothetical protein
MAVELALSSAPAVLAVTENGPDGSLSEALRDGLMNYESAVDITRFGLSAEQEGLQDSIDTISEAVTVVRKMPEMFCVGFETSMRIKYGFIPGSGMVVTDVVFNYTNNKAEADERLDEVNKKIDEIIKENVNEGMTDLQKALNLHDYLVLNTEYDLSGKKPDVYGGYSAYDILICGNGVCEGYSQAYNMLLDRVGVPSIMVTSDAMNHAWNLVNIDGSWYHVDVTWDDPVPDYKGRADHGYFMLSDEAISRTDSEKRRNRAHSDWNSKGLTAESDKYDNAFWSSVSTEIFTRGDYWYYIDEEGVYSRYTESTGQTDKFISLCEDNWYVWGQYSSFWKGKYMSLIISGDRVYFNSPTQIYVMNLDGSMKSAVGDYINPNDTNGYVYGMKLEGNTIYAVIKQKPEDEGKLYEAVTVEFENEKVSVIESIADLIKAMPEGSSRSFDLSEDAVLPAEAISAMKNRNISVTLELGDYSWDIKGTDVTADEASDLNLEIKKDQGIIPEGMIADDAEVIEFDLQHEGFFGLKASLNYTVGSELGNRTAEVYSYSKSENAISMIDTLTVDDEGNIVLDIDKSSCYALVFGNTYSTEKNNGAAVKPEETGDLDGSGRIDISDLTILGLWLLGEKDLDEMQLARADVTGDGAVDLTDLATIKQFLAHKIESF